QARREWGQARRSRQARRAGSGGKATFVEPVASSGGAVPAALLHRLLARQQARGDCAARGSLRPLLGVVHTAHVLDGSHGVPNLQSVPGPASTAWPPESTRALPSTTSTYACSFTW